MADTQHRRKVGTVRPSHLMFTGGVAALIDLPNFPVLVRGLDEWRYDTVPEWEPLTEPRLLAAVGKLLSAPVKQLRPPPWLAETPDDFTGQASRVGVPVMPFPQWLRCTACNRLAPLDSSSTWGFVNDKPRRPEEAKFFHQDCPRKKGSRSLSPRGSCSPASTGTWTTSPTASSRTGAGPAPRPATRRC